MDPAIKSGTSYQVLGMSKAGSKPKDIAEALNVHISSVYRIFKRVATRNENLAQAKARLASH